MIDQRQGGRVPYTRALEQLVLCSSEYPNLGGEDEYLSARGVNISPGGLACETDRSVDPLSRVFVILSLPEGGGERRIRCEGYVAHASFDGRRCLLGIGFHDLDAGDRAAIEAYIAANPAR